MQLFALVSVAIYCFVSLVLGVRLLRMARRTGELPELIVGLAFLVGGMLGYPFNVAAGFLLAAAEPEAARLSYGVGQLGLASGAFLVLVAWWRIFAPDSPAARAVVIGWGLVMIAALGYALTITGPVAGERLTKLPYLALLALQTGCYALMGYASLTHADRLERRSALGMADPVVANRLLLWGLSNAATTTSYVYSIAAGVILVSGLSNIYQPGIVAALGLASACCISLGFLPPQAYVERIRARAAAAGA
jgi:hypothetical protein